MQHDDTGGFRGPFPTFGAAKIDVADIRPPFPIRRVYYIFGTQPGVVRGRHAHRNLRQLAHCVSGACTMVVDDTPYRLDSPEKGVTIGPNQWREMTDFTPDCVLVVYADQPYDATDYVWDRAELT